MNFYKSNIRMLSQYFRSGEKSEGGRYTGVEIEHFLTHKDGSAVGYEELCGILKKIEKNEDKEIIDSGKYFGYYNNDYSITLEPAAQLEISIAPRESSAETFKIYDSFITRFNAESDFCVYTEGIHPHARAEELELIPKDRYKYMDKYFKDTGKHGINMMRSSASAQISVDYFNESDFVKKFRLANILSPIIALITDNSPVYEGRKNYNYIIRSQIWNDVDNVRCGVIPTLMDKDFGYEKYAQYLMTNPIILYERDGKTVYSKEKTPSQIYDDRVMSIEEAEHIMSMFFFDVRLKTYIEIRIADCMEKEYTAAYNELIRDIFYDDSYIDRLMKSFGNLSVKDIENAKKEIMKKGYEAEVYGMSAAEAAELMLNGAGNECALLKELVENRTTLRELKLKGNVI